MDQREGGERKKVINDKRVDPRLAKTGHLFWRLNIHL
jgi:hypothetical protein